MSRFKRWAKAGRAIFSFLNPALRSQYGSFSCLVVGMVFLGFSFWAISAYVVGHGAPVPERKPAADPFILVQSSGAAGLDRPFDTQTYKSPMANGQTDLYAKIFQYQALGDMDQADALIAQLKDTSLMGHVTAQRLLHPQYKAGFDALAAWLTRYADHPQAPAIERLAALRRPADGGVEIIPARYQKNKIEEHDARMRGAKTYVPLLPRSAQQTRKIKDLMAKIQAAIQEGAPARAKKIFDKSDAASFMDDVEKDRALALIAAGFLYQGSWEQAGTIARRAMGRSGLRVPLAGWVYGLSAWHQGSFHHAARAFAMAANSDYASAWMVSAASFWAARSYERMGDKRRVRFYQGLAAEYPTTFYGLLAAHSMGARPRMNWQPPTLSPAAEQDILQTPAGQRAEKLIAAGEVSFAEAELMALYNAGDLTHKKDLLAFAYQRGLPNLTMKLGHALSNRGGQRFVAALYPTMPWTPDSGFRIDRALMHAIIRQESRFNAAAENKGSGATGLMQLMPSTADYIAEKDIFQGRDGRHLLKIPEVSLTLGQRYIEHLLNHPAVGQDLLSLAIAYNAGPGTLSKWKAERAEITDPLLFIESIPYAETRAFVERVISNYWVYRLRFDQKDESLQALASGDWARYAAQDKDSIRFAQR